MKFITSIIALTFLKVISSIFYKLEVKWLTKLKEDYTDIRMIIFLNHTSLFEPLFIQAAPFSLIYKLSKKMVAPAADITLNRPIVGFFWKLMGPGLISITRKRDKSWFKFLDLVREKNIIVIAPEGRMKRENGLDKRGKPMSVRSGVAEILEVVDGGRLLIAYSGGLHHVQKPGQLFPKIFKTIKMNFELLEIDEYKKSFTSEGIPFRRDIVNDLERRMKENIP